MKPSRPFSWRKWCSAFDKPRRRRLLLGYGGAVCLAVFFQREFQWHLARVRNRSVEVLRNPADGVIYWTARPVAIIVRAYRHNHAYLPVIFQTGPVSKSFTWLKISSEIWAFSIKPAGGFSNEFRQSVKPHFSRMDATLWLASTICSHRTPDLNLIFIGHKWCTFKFALLPQCGCTRLWLDQSHILREIMQNIPKSWYILQSKLTCFSHSCFTTQFSPFYIQQVVIQAFKALDIDIWVKHFHKPLERLQCQTLTANSFL